VVDIGILERALELKTEMIENRRFFHSNPEIGFDLPVTTGRVKEILESLGYEVKSIGKSGLSATVGKPGSTFLIRGDMDALPMAEETEIEFKSENGNMHACGHDIHTSALLGAAKILKEREAELKGTVKLMFQPCEEMVMGARDMVLNGILEDPKVDAAMALHVVHKPLGTVGYSKGSACASSDVFTITITGKGAHGAASYLGVDPINVAVHLHLALQVLNSRETHPDDMVVLTIGMISGGAAANIIPDTVVMKGTIRTMNSDTRDFMKGRLLDISESVAKTFRAECKVEFLSEGVPPMVNDESLTEEITGYIDELLGAGTTYEIPRMTGSEDFSVISEKVPSLLLWVGTGSEEEGFPYGVHNPKVTFNEDAIHKIAAIYAECAIRWLEKID
jgi:amidohydrolase